MEAKTHPPPAGIRRRGGRSFARNQDNPLECDARHRGRNVHGGHAADARRFCARSPPGTRLIMRRRRGSAARASARATCCATSCDSGVDPVRPPDRNFPAGPKQSLHRHERPRASTAAKLPALNAKDTRLLLRAPPRARAAQRRPSCALRAPSAEIPAPRSPSGGNSGASARPRRANAVYGMLNHAFAGGAQPAAPGKHERAARRYHLPRGRQGDADAQQLQHQVA